MDENYSKVQFSSAYFSIFIKELPFDSYCQKGVFFIYNFIIHN